MISDIDILSVLKNRTDYERYFPFIKPNLLTKEGEIIGKYINDYYDKHTSVEEINWSNFMTWFMTKHPTMDAGKKKIYTHIFNSIEAYEMEDDYSKIIMTELVRKAYATKIAEEALSIADGKSDEPLDSLEAILEEGKQELGNYTDEDDSSVGFTYDELFDTANDPVLEFSLQELRDSCSGIHKGNFVVIGAHPDTGKTAFIIDQLVHMVQQLPDDKIGIYFNNEQAGKDINKRFLSRILGLSTEDIELDPKSALAAYHASEFAGKIKMYDNAFTDRFVIDKLKKHKEEVGLICFDQLWKVQMTKSKSTNEFMALGKQYAWGREIAKNYAPTMTVHQLDGASTNTKYIDMQAMFGSKVALQGEADMIINIGRITDGSEPVAMRHFYVPKNKLSGGDPTKRNNRFDALINHELCKYEDIK